MRVSSGKPGSARIAPTRPGSACAAPDHSRKSANSSARTGTSAATQVSTANERPAMRKPWQAWPAIVRSTGSGVVRSALLARRRPSARPRPRRRRPSARAAAPRRAPSRCASRGRDAAPGPRRAAARARARPPLRRPRAASGGRRTRRASGRRAGATSARGAAGRLLEVQARRGGGKHQREQRSDHPATPFKRDAMKHGRGVDHTVSGCSGAPGARPSVGRRCFRGRPLAGEDGR